MDVVEDFNGKSVIFMRLHHSFSDAMGILGVVSLLNTKATHHSIPMI